MTPDSASSRISLTSSITLALTPGGLAESAGTLPSTRLYAALNSPAATLACSPYGIPKEVCARIIHPSPYSAATIYGLPLVIPQTTHSPDNSPYVVINRLLSVPLPTSAKEVITNPATSRLLPEPASPPWSEWWWAQGLLPIREAQILSDTERILPSDPQGEQSRNR